MSVVVRTQDEIVARVREAMRRDMFGFEAHEYFAFLDAAHAREFLKPDADLSDWPPLSTLDDLNARAKEYLAFWLEKIEGERGISVGRATAHFIAWKWLLGHPDSDTFPGSLNNRGGGWYQRDAYNYIKNQIDSGAWDRMNADAIEGARVRA